MPTAYAYSLKPATTRCSGSRARHVDSGGRSVADQVVRPAPARMELQDQHLRPAPGQDLDLRDESRADAVAAEVGHTFFRVEGFRHAANVAGA